MARENKLAQGNHEGEVLDGLLYEMMKRRVRECLAPLMKEVSETSKSFKERGEVRPEDRYADLETEGRMSLFGMIEDATEEVLRELGERLTDKLFRNISREANREASEE